MSDDGFEVPFCGCRGSEGSCKDISYSSADNTAFIFAYYWIVAIWDLVVMVPPALEAIRFGHEATRAFARMT